MSKQRAALRAERERARRDAAAKNSRRQSARARRRRRAEGLRGRLPRRTRSGRAQGVLARRRRMQNALLAGVFVVVQVLVWVATPDWGLRVGAAVVGLLALPVLSILLFDRRT